MPFITEVAVPAADPMAGAAFKSVSMSGTTDAIFPKSGALNFDLAKEKMEPAPPSAWGVVTPS